MPKTHYISGEHNFICDSCARKKKSSEARERWDGFMVCKECWEPRQPQDFVQTKEDKIVTEWARVEPDDQFISVPYVFTPDPPPNGTFN